jgi:hypothetical protein
MLTSFRNKSHFPLKWISTPSLLNFIFLASDTQTVARRGHLFLTLNDSSHRVGTYGARVTHTKRREILDSETSVERDKAVLEVQKKELKMIKTKY